VRVAAILYGIGAVVALFRTDAAWPVRLALAVLWPLGPAAFVATVTLLLAASLIAFPVVGVLVALAGVAWLLTA
jgi:hypothetical protein